MKLSIIIPVYNEEKTLEVLLSKLNKLQLNGVEKETIIVDDGSIDKTKEIIKKFTQGKIVKLCHENNLGKGSAVRTGLKRATGDYVIIQDADLEYNSDDYEKLVELAREKNADAVYGSRFILKNNYFDPLYYLANKLLTVLTNILYNSNLTDMETCYKLFKRDVFISLSLESNGFEFEPEVTAKVLLKSIKIHEVPITYRAREVNSGKKVKFMDGVKAVYVLIKYRFFY
ncbi:MAG: glycosyltransferase family 2 protein [Candidatus Omnitrophica bacterium]|nr:glycosyltransferase family 2 protein [Candidatus Omnitrophota bacterium]